jgi:hypothetical protein
MLTIILITLVNKDFFYVYKQREHGIGNYEYLKIETILLFNLKQTVFCREQQEITIFFYLRKKL